MRKVQESSQLRTRRRTWRLTPSGRPSKRLRKSNLLESKSRNFRETIDTIIKLNVDPTKGDQMIRGTVNLPAGTGKEIRVCVFADKVYHDELREAGADVIGDD